MEFNLTDGAVSLASSGVVGGYAWILSKINRRSLENMDAKIEKNEERLTEHMILLAKAYTTKEELKSVVHDLKLDSTARFDRVEALLSDIAKELLSNQKDK